MAAGIDVTADAVLRREETHEIHILRLIQDINRGLQVAVHAAGVGEQAHFLAFETGEAAVTEHFDARLDHRCETAGLCLRTAAGAERQHRHGP